MKVLQCTARLAFKSAVHAIVPHSERPACFTSPLSLKRHHCSTRAHAPGQDTVPCMRSSCNNNYVATTGCDPFMHGCNRPLVLSTPSQVP